MKYIYIGGFPPPYGGVTRKNQLLYSEFSKHIDIMQASFYDKDKRIISKAISLFTIFASENYGFIIGISKGSLTKLTYLLYLTNRRIMRNSIVMVMGGTASQMIAKNVKLRKWVKEYKQLYVETNGMMQILESVNVNNVSVFPNCRKRPQNEIISTQSSNRLRCVFFSLISKDKGVDIIIEATKLLELQDIKYYLEFYGHIETEYKMEFEALIYSNENLHYCGVYKPTSEDDLYKKLHEYDILLFPTKWSNEGVPGILVESKIASLPAIVSDINYNSEIIEDGVSGIVLQENTAMELAEAIKKVNDNRKWLQQMRVNAKNSAEYYYIDRHIGKVLRTLE